MTVEPISPDVMTDAEVDSLLERYDQTHPKMQRRIVAAFAAKVAMLQMFKDYVHGRLDKISVPHHPNPENHDGCRIGSRLDWLQSRLEPVDALLIEALTAAMLSACDMVFDRNFGSRSAMETAIKSVAVEHAHRFQRELKGGAS